MKLLLTFLFPWSMTCFITIKDKTGINDTFTFCYQQETCLNLNESSLRAVSHSVSAEGERQLQDHVVQCVISYTWREPTFCIMSQKLSRDISKKNKIT